MDALTQLRKDPALLTLIVLSLGLLVLKIVFIAMTGVVDDEALYYVWGQNLSLGYLDHEPMVAYINRLSTMIFGATPFGLRIGGILLWIAGSAVAYGFGKSLNNAASGLLFLALVNLTPFFAGNAFVMTTDTPSLLFIFLTVWMYYLGLFKDKRYFYLAGIALGLAMLSRSSVAGVVFAIGIFMLISHRRKEYLLSREFWLSCLIAVAIYTPFLIWNAQNDWIFFRYALGRQLVKAGGGFRGFFELWISQLGLYFPALFFSLACLVPWYTARGVLHAIKGTDDARERKFFLAIISFIPAIFILQKSLTVKVEANWPAFMWAGAAALLALWLSERWRMPAKIAFLVNSVLAAILTALVLLHAIHPFLPVKPSVDVTRRYYTYQAFNGALKDHYRTAMDTNVRIAGLNYQIPSMASFYLKPHKQPLCLDFGTYHATAYEFWFSDSSLIGESMYLITGAGDAGNSNAASARFKSMRYDGCFTSYRGKEAITSFDVFYCTGYRGNGKTNTRWRPRHAHARH
ncbi:MAG: glycosyltransferase family 39 protein [Spirochaetota bacterium]